MVMRGRFIRTLAFWMSACLLAVASGGVALAEERVGNDAGKVAAIDVYRGSDNTRLNAATETRDVNLRVGDRVRVDDGRIYRI